MSSEEDDPYSFSKWFADPIKRHLRERLMESHGLPLEIKTKRTLGKAGYPATRSYFDDYDPKRGSTVRRELDFLTQPKTIETVTLSNGLKIHFRLILFGECKRSNVHDFFAFKTEPGELTTLSILDFPLRFYREPIPPQHLMMGSLQNYFKFPFVMERMVEAHAKSVLNQTGSGRGDKPYSDERTHDACDTLMAARAHFKPLFTANYDKIRSQAFLHLRTPHNTTAHAMQGQDPRSIVREFVKKEVANIVRVLPGLYCTFAAPLFVIDDNRGLVETVLNDDGSISFEGEAGVILYPYVSERTGEQYDALESCLPVTVCKHSALKQAIDILERGTEDLLGAYKPILNNAPDSVLEEVFLTEVEINRKQGIF